MSMLSALGFMLPIESMMDVAEVHGKFFGEQTGLTGRGWRTGR